MALEVEPLAIDGLKLITPARHGDARGFFSEIYNRRDFAAIGIADEFVQDNHALSAARGTVRGLHFQLPPSAQAKLVRCAHGSILDVTVDLRRRSQTYGKHVAVELSETNWRELFVPAGLAHGYCTLEADTEVLYKVTAPYAPALERGIRWNDPALGIAWPAFAGSLLSARDRELPLWADFSSPF